MPWSVDNLPASVSKKDWTDEQKKEFCKQANAILKESGDEGIAIATAIKHVEGDKEKQNASQFPRVFYARHMQPGLVGYEDETIYVDLDAIKNMMPSGVGKPVFIHHDDVDLATMKEKAAGYVTESFYNELDGWAWFKILAIDDAAHQAIAKRWSVSNAYIPHAWGEAGMQNNCPYNRKMLGGEFTHLAIVPNPRYEEACIMSPEEFKVYQDAKKTQADELRNSKTEKTQEIAPMLKFFRKSKEQIENAADVSDEDFVEFEGKSILVKDLRQLTNAKKNDMNEEFKKDEDKKDKKEEKENDSECYDLDGEKVSIEDLKNAYRSAKKNMKKNADKDDDKAKDEEEKENDDEDMDDMENKKQKKNSKDTKHFDEMRNAPNTFKWDGSDKARVIDTSIDKLARGKELFSLNHNK